MSELHKALTDLITELKGTRDTYLECDKPDDESCCVPHCSWEAVNCGAMAGRLERLLASHESEAQ